MKKMLLALMMLLCYGCQKPGESTTEDTGPHTAQASNIDVLVNIAPYAYFVERIAGSLLRVETLIPEGINPHVYEPTPKQVRNARSAKIWFRLGEPQENKILKILAEQNPDLTEIDLCKNIRLLPLNEHDCTAKHPPHTGHTHEGKDRHVWLSPRLARYQVKKMTAALIKLYPEHAQIFLQNAADFVQELRLLSENLKEQLAPFKGQAILVSHPAFGYFCRDFNLLQLAVECDGKEPRPQDVARLIRLAKEYNVRSAFLQVGYNNKGAEMIAKKLQLPTYLVDPYARNYEANLQEISNYIAQ